MNKAFDVRHPFFRPLWVRIAVVGLCFGWALFEVVSGSPFWGMLFGAAGSWCGYWFFLAFDPADYEKEQDTT